MKALQWHLTLSVSSVCLSGRGEDTAWGEEGVDRLPLSSDCGAGPDRHPHIAYNYYNPTDNNDNNNNNNNNEEQDESRDLKIHYNLSNVL